MTFSSSVCTHNHFCLAFATFSFSGALLQGMLACFEVWSSAVGVAGLQLGVAGIGGLQLGVAGIGGLQLGVAGIELAVAGTELVG